MRELPRRGPLPLNGRLKEVGRLRLRLRGILPQEVIHLRLLLLPRGIEEGAHVPCGTALRVGLPEEATSSHASYEL